MLKFACGRKILALVDPPRMLCYRFFWIEIGRSLMRWRPAHETHAIERVNLTIQFGEQVPSRVWLPLMNAASDNLHTAGYSSAQTPQSPSLGMSPIPIPGFGAEVLMIGPNGIPMRQQPMLERAFALLTDGELRAEVRFSQSTVFFTFYRYPGWVDISKLLNNSIGEYLQKSLDVVSISFFKMEYWDRFTFFDEIEKTTFTELLSDTSKHVPPFALVRSGLWHSHVGYFADHPTAKRLVNLNIDVVDIPMVATEGEAPELRRSAGIYTMVQDSLPPEVTLDFESVASHLDDMHLMLKELLGDVITPELSTRISLSSGFQA